VVVEDGLAVGLEDGLCRHGEGWSGWEMVSGCGVEGCKEIWQEQSVRKLAARVPTDLGGSPTESYARSPGGGRVRRVVRGPGNNRKTQAQNLARAAGDSPIFGWGGLHTRLARGL
jgi:hypothetical protein